jgi:hypothetical protein
MNGALVFAFNNEQIDYVSMAAWSARRIHRHLDIPVCLVTDTNVTDPVFDRVVKTDAGPSTSRHFADYGANVIWHNGNRASAYELSPWDTTLVLDADYIVASDRLATLFESGQDFLAHDHAYDVTGRNDFSGLNAFGRHHMPMWWATVMMFRRSKQAELVFDSMTMVRNNWQHYRNLYGNSQGTFRNDHALTIALGIVNGHTLDHSAIPWSLACLTPQHELEQTNTDTFRVNFVTDNNKPKWIELNCQDFHAMGKKTLGDIVASTG